MVLRKCTICDRRFKKTEHFKRHERSRQSISWFEGEGEVLYFLTFEI